VIRIFVPSGHYLPGYRGGGPVRSLANLVAALGDDHAFHIVAYDRDMGATEPYSDVTPGRWAAQGKARVWYVRAGGAWAVSLWRLLRSTPHDVLYLNSFFDPLTALLPVLLRAGRAIPRRPLIVAARGQFSPGALGLKRERKAAYLALTRALGLWRDAWLHATSTEEMDDLRRTFGTAVADRIVFAPNLGPPLPPPAERPPKIRGQLRLAFVSRISPKKNLLYAIERLSGLAGAVTLDIFGPLEDAEYWRECQAAAARLVGHPTVRYAGELPNERVMEVVARHDLLILPTLGESYGHVVAEALAAGCPVLVSNRTPWRGLAEAWAGWDLPLEDPAGFGAVLECCVAMGEEEHRRLREGARSLAAARLEDQAAREAHRRMFAMVTGHQRRGKRDRDRRPSAQRA
jgi:glycosyltransferase involved in cell wall biosynthesis